MAPKTLEVKFRPPRKEGKVAARIYVSSDNLMHLTGSLDNGKPCFVEVSGDKSTRREATLWLDRQLTGTPGAKPSPVRTTEAFHEAGGFGLADTHIISYVAGAVPDAAEVVMEEITSTDVARPLTPEQVAHWTGVLMGQLEGQRRLPPCCFRNSRPLTRGRCPGPGVPWHELEGRPLLRTEENVRGEECQRAEQQQRSVCAGLDQGHPQGE